MSELVLDLILKSFVVAAAGLAATGVMRRGSAAARHFVLALTVAGLLVLPVVSLFGPHWAMPFLRVSAAVPLATRRSEGSSALTSEPSPSPAQASSPNPSPSPVWILWPAVAGLFLVNIGVRLIRLRAMEQRLDMSADSAVQTMVNSHCRRSQRHVLLLEGASNEPPMTWGHFRPVMLLPLDAGQWQLPRLQSVVLHELAHVERGDWLAGIAAQIACAAYWFNPLVWLIAARMGAESEIAADDRVIGQGFSPAEYAANLLEVLRDIRRSRSEGGAALAMARPGSLDGRVRAILEDRRCRRPVQGKASLGMLALASVGVLAIGAAAPRVVLEPQKLVDTDLPPVPIDATVESPPPVRHRIEIPSPSQIAKKTAAARSTPEVSQSLAPSRRPGVSSAGINRPRMGRTAAPQDLDVVAIPPADLRKIQKLRDLPKQISAALHSRGNDFRIDDFDAKDAIAEGSAAAAKSIADAKRELALSLAESQRELDGEKLPASARAAAQLSLEIGRQAALAAIESTRASLKLLPRAPSKQSKAKAIAPHNDPPNNDPPPNSRSDDRSSP